MLIEDNQYALSVPWRYQSAAPSVVDNLASFQGIRIQSVEGGEIEALYGVIQSAIAGARKGEGPQLIHVKVPRLTGHNWQDPAAYKSAEEKAEDARRDPLARLITWLQDERGVSAARIAEMTEQAAAFALEQGEAAWTQGHEPQGASAMEHLFAPVTYVPETAPIKEGPRLTMQASLIKTLDDEMARDPSVLVFGEDVGAFGGVHRLTDGLAGKVRGRALL